MDFKRLIDSLTNTEKQCNDILANGDSILVSINIALQLITKEYKVAKQNYITHKFLSQAEEIIFFKLYNSRLIKLGLYYRNIQKIEEKLISKSSKKQLSILKSIVSQMDQFSTEYKEFIIYIKSESNHFDHLYFTSNNKLENQILFSSFERDPDFSTHHSFLLGKILSTLLTYQYIDRKLEQLKNKQTPTVHFEKVKWNKSKTDFVELVYAIHASGAIDTDISKLFNILAQVIETGPLDEYNKWKNIKNRVNSQPRFLPKLLNSLQSKIDQDFE